MGHFIKLTFEVFYLTNSVNKKTVTNAEEVAQTEGDIKNE